VHVSPRQVDKEIPTETLATTTLPSELPLDSLMASDQVLYFREMNHSLAIESLQSAALVPDTKSQSSPAEVLRSKTDTVVPVSVSPQVVSIKAPSDMFCDMNFDIKEVIKVSVSILMLQSLFHPFFF
jgi:hypothetical protein